MMLLHGQGNPLCLLDAYPSQVVSQLPQLEHFDGRPAASAASSPSNNTMPGNQSQNAVVPATPPNNTSLVPLVNVELQISLTDVMPAARLVMDTMQSNCTEPGMCQGVDL